MNVLFISSWYPHPGNKTHGIFVKRYAEAASLYNKVAVIHTYGQQDFPDKITVESRTENNVFEVFVYFEKKKINPFSKFHNYKKHYLLGLDHLLKNWGKPDLLQVNVLFPAGIAGLEIAGKLNIPFIVSEHWTGYHPSDGSYKGFFRKYFTKKAAQKAAQIITVTNDLKERMLSHGLNGGYTVIPNVVDTSTFKCEPVLNGKRFRFLHVSSLDPEQKNVGGIIDVFMKLNKEIPATELFIIGESFYRKELEQKADSLLNNSVFFLGQKTGQELADEFNRADSFVMFSNYENLPVVILEAMCCGLPVISSDVGGIKEWLDEKSGMLITVGNQDELLNSMKRMIANAGHFSRKLISDRAHENFSYERIGKLFTKVYDKVIQKK